jgi:glyoxylase-like metal-dependent hydrolase (beta-lactamase superfamily II)
VSEGPQAADGQSALAARGIALLRAPNPGPLTLAGTNTWLVGRDPTWLIDPGPLIDSHLTALLAAIAARGGLGGVALTHRHRDHGEALDALRAEHPAPLAAGRGPAEVTLADGMRFGPLLALATPGHAPDHFALIAGDACFAGDAVLGEGSVFISAYPGAMSSYMAALERLRAREDLALICPGHGPVVLDPQAKLDEYLSHRRERERMLRAALERGALSTGELLDEAWSDVPAPLRAQATVTLAAHLDKLDEEGLVPAGVQRPEFEGVEW